MTEPEPSLWRVCPFLGLPDDPGSHYSFPELAHRCHAQTKVAPVELGFQATYCLGGQYEDCLRFRSATAPIPAWHSAASQPRANQPATSGGGHVLRTIAGRGLSILVGVLMIALVAGGVIALSSLTNPRQPGTIDTAAFTPTPVAVGPSQLPAEATPAGGSVVPTGEPTAEPSVRVTPRPRPTSTPSAEATPVVHVVEEGESLSLIAAQYGLTWIDLARANELHNPDTLYVGQRLFIPIGPLPSAGIAVHVVEPGETLASIAFQYGFTARELAEANELENRNLIYVGERLIIPSPTP